MSETRGPKAVMVVGAGGFIGTHVVDALLASSTPVIAATRSTLTASRAGMRNVVDPFVDAAAFDGLLKECKAVVHAAAYSTPGSSMATPQLEGDLRTTLSLLEALQSHTQCRLVFLSSAGTLYGECAAPAREGDSLHPRSYHGAGKAAAEHFIEAWATQHGGTAVILRLSNVYGEGQVARRGFAIVPTAMRCTITGDELQVYGDGSQVRDFLHVEDLKRLCLTAMSAPLPAGTHVFNASSGVPTSINSLLTMIEAATSLPLRRRYAPPRAADIQVALVDPASARDRLGWQASVTLSEGLAATWEWLRDQQ